MGIIRSCMVLLAMFLGLNAAAQEVYPNRPITIIVNVAPGTGADIMARLIAPKLSDRLRQPVIVENRVGASGVIGTEAVAQAAPNGYTLMLMINSFTIVPWLYKNLPYDSIADITPISKIASTGYAFVVNPDSMAARDFNEFLATAKASPGKLSYASPGKGTVPHLLMELFKQRMGLDILHVPHKDAGAANASVIGGHVNMEIAVTAAILPAARSGKVKMLAMTGPKRSPFAADIPTFQELGITFMDADGWYALAAPGKTPPAVVAMLYREMKDIMALPDIGEQLAKQGMVPMASTPEEIAAQIKSDIQQWGKIVSDAGIAAD